MKKVYFLFVCSTFIFANCNDKASKTKNSQVSDTSLSVQQSDLTITPIQHATAVIEFDSKTIYMDPTGGLTAFEKFKSPDFVCITDIHGDHMNLETLRALDLTNSILIVPQAVASKLGELKAKQIIVMNNGETKKIDFLSIEAIPMYNLREEALKFHEKGRGNGYVLTLNNQRIYFSGDTEDIPEMRALKNIDKAFVCMNLPYIMTVESAASAVLEFQPKQVYPYHYRGSNGKSDVIKFQQIVENGNKNIDVVQLKWY